MLVDLAHGEEYDFAVASCHMPRVTAEEDLVVEAIHNESGYQAVRKTLAKQYAIALIEPDVQVVNLPESGRVAQGVRQCPKCGAAALIHQEGCDLCTGCGYSKCS